MRTTLSLDDDVAALLDRARKTRGAKLKDVVNEALRQGLSEMARPRRRAVQHHTRQVALGRCLVASIDDVAETLAVAEGDPLR